MKKTTLLFLVDKDSNKICLAMKKRGFGIGRWNGVGGKVEEGEAVETAAIREAREEIGVDIKRMNKIAELSFNFIHNNEWDQLVHVYFSDHWEGEPVETDEMRPMWFSAKTLPLDEMWPDDEFWLPEAIKGNLIKGFFKFGENDVIIDKRVNIVQSL